MILVNVRDSLGILTIQLEHKYQSFHSQQSFLLWLLILTPCSRLLPEKPTGFQLVKKFPAIYGIRRFITALKSARHPSLVTH